MLSKFLSYQKKNFNKNYKKKQLDKGQRKSEQQHLTNDIDSKRFNVAK